MHTPPLLYFLLITFSIWYMAHRCTGCKTSFPNKRSLALHRAQCTSYSRHGLRPAIPPKSVSEADGAILEQPEAEIAAGSGLADEIVCSPRGDNTRQEQMITDEPQEPLPLLHPSGRPKRRAGIPRRFRDTLPPPPPLLPLETPLNIPIRSPERVDTTSLPRPVPEVKTDVNTYGIYRVYPNGAPTFSPDDTFKLSSVSDSPNFTQNQQTQSRDNSQALPFVQPSESERPSYFPFSNKSTHMIMNWHYDGSSTMSASKLNSLVRDVLLDPDFKSEDLKGFDAEKESKRLDNFNTASGSTLTPNEKWIETSVPISLPPEKKGSYVPEDRAPIYNVQGLFYRKPMEVIKAAFSERAAQDFHITPFEEYWQPSPDSLPTRVFSELYNSDAYLQEHAKLLAQTRTDNLEPVIAAVMLWSDSTHLTSFGNASMWPIYLYLGNLSKYTRCKPTSFSAHHLAYIPKLDDAIQDAYQQHYGEPASAEMLTHLRRELMQAIWALILDDNLKDAYINGIPLKFSDGVIRRLFIRFFIYGADYPEKVLLSGIKYLGEFPCPRCLIKKCDIHKLGTKWDMRQRERNQRVDNRPRQFQINIARKWIFEEGEKVTSAAMSRLLGPKSLVPTRNAFSALLLAFGINFYAMLAPDFLHEFEIGVWKAVFTQLLRILYALGGDRIQILNSRYRQMATFGRDTIRKFTNNVSGMKKLAARDFEDLLQCAIPAFEGLFEGEDNVIVQDLLFELATWHFLAKLRLHTEITVKGLEASMTRLGDALRKFESITCAKYATKDLPSEEAARGRRTAALAEKNGTHNSAPRSKKSHIRKFNLSTYKLHALGDYANYIRRYGTTDGFSTQTGELEHRRVKRFYGRVHKGKYTAGIAKHMHRERCLYNMGSSRSQATANKPVQKRRRLGQKLTPSIPFENTENLPAGSPEKHYQMSDSTEHPIELSTWLGDNEDDPALHGFLDNLKDHLLSRILGIEYDGDDKPFSDEERAKVIFVRDRIYRHKVLRINYTTYDMRRDQDSLNARTHANIMLLAHDTGPHPYWYARILGVFHAVVRHPTLPDPVSMDFVWIRWYGFDNNPQNPPTGWKARRLHRLGFVPHDTAGDPDASPAFGFLDPNHIIRGVHILPAYHHGVDESSLPPSSTARLPSEDDSDYKFYYVMQFVDRDMGMRFRGGGVGHKSTREATNIFRSDRYAHDLAGTQWHDIVNPADVAAEPSTTAGNVDDEYAGGGGHEVERAEEDGGEGEDDAGGEKGDDEDIYLEEEIEQRWRQEREAITAAQDSSANSHVDGGAEDDDAESVSGESSNASETSSKYDGDDIPQDILGPEDGQGEVNEIDNLGYANL